MANEQHSKTYERALIALVVFAFVVGLLFAYFYNGNVSWPYAHPETIKTK